MASGLAAGFLVGLAIAASPGPIFFLVVRRTLEHGPRSGLASGAGVATADGVYALLAAFGVSAVTTLLAERGHWLTAAGGLALLILGGRTLLSRPASPSGPDQTRRTGLAADYASTLALTLANPQTILAFAAVVAGLGGLLPADRRSLAAVVAGVALGSATWWLLLSLAVGSLRRKLGPGAVRVLTLISGVAIAGFGLAALLRSFR